MKLILRKNVFLLTGLSWAQASHFAFTLFSIAHCLHVLLVVLTRLKTKKYARWELNKWFLVALTGCFYKKMYGHFAGPKKSGRNNEVVVLTSWS